MNSDRKTVTMLDVAREAGVALGTVSKVINHQPVGEKYRKKVQDAAQRLGYQYNATGKALRTNRTDMIAVIIPNTVNPYFALLVHYLNLELEKRNNKMLLCFTEYDRSRENEFIEMAQLNRVDGIIALTYNPKLSIPEGIPFVTIDRFFSSSVPCVASDNFGGGVLAAKKLQELGCRKIAMLFTGSPLTSEPSKRKDGFASCSIEMGMPFEVKVVPPDHPIEDYGAFLREHFREDRLEFDGLFVGTDQQAWEVIQILKEMGVRVPEDVQVIGFDGIEMFGNHGYIVSTIVQPVREIAEVCASMVLSDERSRQPSLVCLPVRYAYGGTTQDA